MAVPERSRAQPKFWALGLGEPFIAGLCGKGIWLRLNGCVAAVAAGRVPQTLLDFQPKAILVHPDLTSGHVDQLNPRLQSDRPLIEGPASGA
jgi:hypothetical protein